MWELIPQIVLITDSRGNLIDYNQRWYDYTGLSREETFKDSGMSALHPDDVERVSKQANDSRHSLESFIAEYRLRRHDGVYRWMLCRLVKMNSANEQDVQGFGTITDIDDQKRVQLELEKEKEAREQFVSMLTHDLRSPLTAAKISADVLAKKSELLGEKYALYPQRIISNLKRAEKMIDNLLDANHINAGKKLFLKKEDLNLHQLINEAIADLSLIHGERFVFKCDQKAVISYGSSESIRRVLENLCNNAVKFGSKNLPVTISLICDENTSALSVHNFGEAIPKEEQKRLFEIHQRIVRDDQEIKGWGLGLTLVRGIAEAHGGKVFVESEERKGTTFTVVLPRNG